MLKVLLIRLFMKGILDFLEQNPSIGRRVIEKALLAARVEVQPEKQENLLGEKVRWAVLHCQENLLIVLIETLFFLSFI